MHARNPLTTLLASLSTLAFLVFAGCGSTTNTSGNATGATCAISNDCPAGQICSAGVCVAKSTGDIAVNFDSSVPDAGGTKPDGTTKDDSGTPGTDATTQPDTSTGPNLACQACKVDADCGDASYQCITLLNGTFCAKKCSTVGECPAAFKCDKADTKAANNNCLPPNYSCDGCLVTPCDPGQSCVASTGQCAVVKQQCDSCNSQLDCADGLKCVQIGSAGKVCAPTCDGGGACPDNSTCQKTVVGNICAYQASTCCYGANCTVASACSSCADKCFGGACVACLNDGQCPGGTCDANSHTCITSGACQAPTPIKLADGTCVECTSDTHCGSSTVGPKCDLSTHKCAATSASNQCAACVAPYPGCVQLNGTWSCVECTTDADCAAKNAGTCNGTTYTCKGTVSGGTGPTSGNCKSDADCQNAGTTTFTLACDTSSGLCYDTTGQCDNISAFCNSAKGSSCVQASSIPGLPTGTGTGANPGVGTCSCASSAAAGGGENAICKLLAPTCDCTADPNSTACCTGSPFGSCCPGSSCGSSGGLPDLSCLSNTTPASDCFGSLPCTCGFASLLGGSGGASVPHTCGKGTLGGP